jgi:hypothetical protein
VRAKSGLLETGPPDPQFVGVYWKPLAGDLLSVVGYKLPAATVVEVAQHVTFNAPGEVSLPIAPGPIVTASRAVSVARQASHRTRSTAQAKLTTWTEIAAVLQAGHNAVAISKPAHVTDAPWQPAWAVLLSGPHSRFSSSSSRTSTGSSNEPSSSVGELVIIDAASGKVWKTMATPSHQSWYAALTNRDPTTRGCPGGSTARLPFGVLTRDEAAYTGAHAAALPTQGGTTSMVLKLTTVPALNRADPGLYGGCIQQNCSLRELVWPTMVVVHAAPGETLACLPPWASSPDGYQPKRVHQYVTISVAESTAIYCGGIPRWVQQLRDLAPATN